MRTHTTPLDVIESKLAKGTRMNVTASAISKALGCLVVSLLLSWLLAASTAYANVEIESFSGLAADSVGGTFNQAGGNPYSATTTIRFSDANSDTYPDEMPRNINVDLPPGFVGNPQAIPQCDTLGITGRECPVSSIVGEVALRLGGVFAPITVYAPIYNVAPSRGVPAQFSFVALAPLVTLQAKVRPDDYGLSIDVRNISTALGLRESKVTFWGNPASPVFDAKRCQNNRLNAPTCTGPAGNPATGPNAAGVQPRVLLNNPANCSAGPLETRVFADSWENSGRRDTEGRPDSGDSRWAASSFAADTNGQPTNVTGCESVPFSPHASVVPTTSRADAPSGINFTLTAPHDDSPGVTAHAPLKRATVILPEGMAVNPSAANGLESCAPEEIELGSDAAPSCQEGSKIGTVEIETPLLAERLKGAVYLADQGTNPFNSLLAMYVVASSKERGVTIKLAGRVTPDEATGQLTTVFDDNPQMPFTKLTLRLKGGSSAPLVTPSTCGSFESEARLTPWSAVDPDNPTEDEIVTRTSSFTIDRGPDGGPCKAGDPNQPGDPADLADRPFNPEMKAGLQNATANGKSPFIFQLTREDGDQEILSTTVKPPQGLTAKLAGIPYCSEADIASINCPEESKIGSELAGAGAGSSPFYTSDNPGSVYLAGPYKGAPLSMVITEPVIAGPLDLDDIAVRAAIHVDPRTAQLTVISDEIPQINSGIPLRVRDLRIKMDRPDFTIAPTNCDPMEIQATVQGSHRAEANLTNHFQVGDCGNLGFDPKLKLDFGKSKKNTKRNAHPPLKAKLAFNGGDSNISSVEVALPQGLLLDQDRLGRICSRARYAAGTCPEESRVGYAKAETPLLDDPVEGPVYLKASDNPLPDLAADLNGQIDVDLFGRIDQKVNKKGINQIRNTFDVVPDVPVDDFELTLDGGSDGLLVNSRNICKSKKAQKLSIEMAAHNEMTLSERPLIGSACKKLNKKKAKRLKKKANKLKRKAKKTKRKARQASGKKATKLLRKSKKLNKKSKKLRKQARKLGR